MKTTPHQTAVLHHPLCALTFGCLLALASPAEALTQMELDFQNFTSNETQALTVRADSSDTLTLSGDGASLLSSASTGIDSTNSKLTTGYAEFTRTGSNNGILKTTNTSEGSNDAEYRDYTGASPGSSYGTNTITFIFQPDFTGALAGSSPGTRSFLFTTDYNGTSTNLVYLQIGGGIKMIFGTGGSSQDSFTFSQPDWDPSKWYMVSASWQEGSETTIYYREVGGEAGSFGKDDSLLPANPGFDITRSVVLGNNGANDGTSYQTPAQGKIAYFLWTDEYTSTEASYNSLYSAVIPEPSLAAGLAGLLTLGCAFILRRRRS